MTCHVHDHVNLCLHILVIFLHSISELKMYASELLKTLIFSHGWPTFCLNEIILSNIIDKPGNW